MHNEGGLLHVVTNSQEGQETNPAVNGLKAVQEGNLNTLNDINIEHEGQKLHYTSSMLYYFYCLYSYKSRSMLYLTFERI